MAQSNLDDVRTRLQADCPGLDSVGADAVMLRVLAERAGRNRYFWPTLLFLIESSYGVGFHPYGAGILAQVLPIEQDKAYGYNPFSPVHWAVPDEDEWWDEPPPGHYRPLRFLEQDLLQWEVELGTSNPDTHRLLDNGEVA